MCTWSLPAWDKPCRIATQRHGALVPSLSSNPIADTKSCAIAAHS